MFEGEDFVFFSDENPKTSVNRFIRDNNLVFDQDIWEYPWLANDGESIIEFNSFDDIFCHVIDQEKPEYIFYPVGGLSCWFGVSNDMSVVFGIQYKGDSPQDLAAFAKKYGGRFGYVAAEEYPDLSGIEAYDLEKKYLSEVIYRDEDFILFGNGFKFQ